MIELEISPANQDYAQSINSAGTQTLRMLSTGLAREGCWAANSAKTTFKSHAPGSGHFETLYL